MGIGVNERFPPVDEPLYAGSQLTKAQSFSLILSYALRRSLTPLGVALSDLLDLINIYCPENVLTSEHLILKELKPIQGHLECHIYCPNCPERIFSLSQTLQAILINDVRTNFGFSALYFRNRLIEGADSVPLVKQPALCSRSVIERECRERGSLQEKHLFL